MAGKLNLAAFAVICFVSVAYGGDVDILKSLFSDTLTGYDTRIRPRIDQSDTVQLTTKFVPQSLLEFDTAEQKFSILGYFRITWDDEVITWDPASYANTDSIKVPVNQIWRPSLIILKEFDGEGVVGNALSDIAKITNLGNVSWVPEGIYSVVCHVDIKYYPFDEQRCIITYYVSDETKTTVVLNHDGKVNLDEFTENSAWVISDVETNRYLVYNTWFIDVVFKLQRRANFTTFTLIMPLLMLAFLNICIFLVPIGSGEKGSFAITIFLSYGIFVTIVSDTLPDNSLQVSLFLLFIIVLLFLSVLSVFYTIIQAKLMASIGDKECSIKCFRPKKKAKDDQKNKVMPFVLEDVEDHPNKGDVHVINGKTEKKKEFEQAVMIDSAVDEEEEEEDIYTWGMFLEKLDTILFVVFFFIILLFSATFFSLMMKRVSDTTFK
ncbi:Neuronal acetylcholine receptor subunit [Mactra antiquata]